MENATKALLIAAGIFFAILIMSAIVVFHSEISSYFTQKHEATVIEQTKKFNARFENYNRKDLRGSDLISLMNRVIDYNSTQSYFEGTNYERIKVTITLGNDDILNQFKYEKENGVTSRNKFLTEEITNTGNGDKWQNDKKLIAIANTSTELCEELKKIGVPNPTDTQLQHLSSNISNIVLDETGTADRATLYRLKRADILEDLLGIKVGSTTDCDIEIDEVTAITKADSKNTIKAIKNIASQYYQYTQFKRAKFDCTEVKYDDKTDRVVEMNFELQVQNATVVFD